MTKPSAEQSELKKILWTISILFIVFTGSILLSKHIHAFSFRETVLVFILIVVMCALPHVSLFLFYKWRGEAPLESLLEQSNDILIKSKYNLDTANKCLVHTALKSQGALIVGSSNDKDKEMMEELFKDYFASPQTIDISFKGTAYGAFSYNNTMCFGFLDALEKHMDGYKGKGRQPFGDIIFVCCTDFIYYLSAKYLCLNIFHKLVNNNLEMEKPLKITYPYKDCMPATLILRGHDSAPKIALISPSIGKNDKEFIGRNYPIGIVIKNVVTQDNNREPAGETILRLERQFTEDLAKGTPETWIYDVENNTVNINNVYQIRWDNNLNGNNIMDELNIKDDDKSFMDKLLKIFFIGYDQSNPHTYPLSIDIETSKLEMVFKFLISCIEKTEIRLRQSINNQS